MWLRRAQQMDLDEYDIIASARIVGKDSCLIEDFSRG